MVEQCIILHAKTAGDLQDQYNKYRKNSPAVKLNGKAFQTSEQGFSLILFYDEPAENLPTKGAKK